MKIVSFRILALTGISALMVWGGLVECAIAKPQKSVQPPASSIPVSPAPSATQPRQYQAQGVMFEVPPGFSDLQPLGNQTVGIVFPVTALPSQRITVRLAELNPSVTGMGLLSPRELAEYARYRFFGMTAAPKDHKTRRFLGQDVTGDVLMQSDNGTATYLEFYVVPLTLQRQLAIAFEADAELPVALLENTIQTASRSMREIPPTKKKKKR